MSSWIHPHLTWVYTRTAEFRKGEELERHQKILLSKTGCCLSKQKIQNYLEKILTETISIKNKLKMRQRLNKPKFLINRRIKGFHVTHCIHSSNASLKISRRSQVNKSNENHNYPSDEGLLPVTGQYQHKHNLNFLFWLWWLMEASNLQKEDGYILIVWTNCAHMHQQVAYVNNEKQSELTFQTLGSGSIFSFISTFSLISSILSSDYVLFAC